MASAQLLHTSARVLEFDSVREMLLGYASSPLGKKRIAALQPRDASARPWIERQQQLTNEIRRYFRAGGRFEFGGLLDLRTLLEKTRIEGAALELEEIRDALLLADRSAQWREIGLHPPVSVNEPWPAVEELTREIADFSGLLGYFKNKILPDGTLDDKASPELSRIRREIEKQRRAIQESLRGYLRRLAEGGAVQDELITIRGERFVIPVKLEQKRKVNGVVHGASSSGQTVYVEPMETIEQNNELVRLIEEEMAEIHRILVEMTRRIGEHAPVLAIAIDVLGEVELQFAKARFAEDYGCVAPILSDSGELAVHQARHPALERNLRAKGGAVVPLSLELTGDNRQLIISGPNTGGKTVALKTIGLLTLMAQSGIPVPAERAQFPIFDSVLADIGDYQSIEQNLSTFSAHVTNIDFISRTATGNSMVLLDELGSATDPEEGAALAVSIADHFRRIGAMTIVSTHHTALKVYAANNTGVLNASVGFDEATLQPTYQLRVGVPGASAGINIAQKLGMNAEIIAAARQRIGTQTRDISYFLDRLNEEVSQIEKERADLRTKSQEVAREKNRLAAEGMNDQRKKVKELENKLDSLLRDFEYRIREAVSAMQDRVAAQKLTKEAERRIAKLRREFKEQFDSAVVAHKTGADIGDPNARPDHVRSGAQFVEEGDTVKLKSMGRNAKVLRKLDGNILEVEMGLMKMKVPRDDIAEVVVSAAREREAQSAQKPAQAARSRGINVSLASSDDSAPSEINVIGQTVDEATEVVEKFVDRAFLAGLSRVRIVHGSGMGILRKALRQFLKGHPHVAGVIEPPQNEGGAGATVVELRG
ncbi:MAG: MutS2 family protein [Candidatus Angelobacter sp.]|jgi:DNA mismatch repair protein MutS2|nr:MutS2 family protein [Candidatus Angelobacter sp.]